MNIHQDIDNLMEAYLVGGLESAERQSMENHMSTCASCTNLVSAAREFSSFMTGSVQDLRPPRDLEDRVILNLRHEAFSFRKLLRGNFVLPRWAKWAACLAILFEQSQGRGREILEHGARVSRVIEL